VPGDQASLLSDQRPNVRAVADLFGPTDVATLPVWASGTYMALFGTHNPTPGQLAVMSPLSRITAHSAPVLIIQGQSDDVVPPSQSILLREALRRHGVDVEWISYAGGHGFQGLDGKAIYSLQLQTADWFVRTLYH
jgi:dipeptidyl aminopeptidase/acylaminoacyl peptidase